MPKIYTSYTPNGDPLPSFIADQPSIHDGAIWFFLENEFIAVIPLSYVVIVHE